MNRVALILASALAPTALAQTYSVIAVDLGPDIVSGWATGISSSGRVVGASSVEGGRRTFGFTWRDGSIEQLVVPQPGNFSVRPRTLDVHHQVIALAVSDAGSYAGVAANVNFGFSMQPFFAWLPSPVPYPPQHVAAEDLGNAIVHDIADTSPFITAVGAGSPGGNSRVGFISLLSRTDDVGDPPRVTLLYGFGGTSSPATAFAVNSAGDVVGFAADAGGIHRPFLRPASTGVMSNLGTLGGPAGEALDISNTGYIVGQADIAPGRPHAFVRAPGASPLLDLGTLGGPVSAARAVNDAGIAVGESWTADGLVHAFVTQGTQVLDLNSRIPTGSGWVLTHASGINNAGLIVGWGRFQGKTRGFLLTPAAPCYPNCDGSTGAPPLTSNDFVCFLNRFAAADPYANCDGSTGTPTLTANDFVCFITRYAAGCS